MNCDYCTGKPETIELKCSFCVWFKEVIETHSVTTNSVDSKVTYTELPIYEDGVVYIY